MGDSLTAIYQALSEKVDVAKRRDITGSTADMIAKAHPKSPMILDYYAELFGLAPEEIKRLPMKSVEMLLQALQHLIQQTKEDPILRQALRKMINTEFATAEEEEEVGTEGFEEPIAANESKEEAPKEPLTEEKIIAGYMHFLSTLNEASKATKFNYKMLLELDPTKLMNPFFVQLVNTFQMEALTRMQKQGMLLFLKKLAELADQNPQIAQALNRIVRLENTAQPEAAPVDESVVQEYVAMLTEATTTSTTVAALPATLQIGNDPKDHDRMAKCLSVVNPSLNMSWEDMKKKYGKMPISDFLKRAGINIDKLANVLTHTFPKINKTVVKRLE